MTYDPTRPADTDLVKKSAELIRENLEGLRKNGIVFAKPPLYEAGEPKASAGENGDRYIDTVTGNHYYKNFNGQWEPNLTLDDKYETIEGVTDIAAEIKALITSAVADCLKKVNMEYNPRIIGEYKLVSHNELSDGWVKSNGGLYNPQKYPKAFAIYGREHGGDGINTFAVPDWRADAIRVNDDGRGIDPGRVLGSEQEDALQNITGTFPGGPIYMRNPSSGVFKAVESAYTTQAKTERGYCDTIVTLDASLAVRTAGETRMRNRSCCMYVYIGRPGIDA